MVETVPPIWRRIELSSQTTLKQFHRILQIALGWSNSRLHEFVVDGQRYGVSDPTYDEPGDVIAEGTVRQGNRKGRDCALARVLHPE
jgi:hypothetical protein